MYQYPKLPDISPVTRMAERPLYWEHLLEYARMKYEQGANKAEIQSIIDHVEKTVAEACAALRSLPDDELLAQREPNGLEAIRAIRPKGQRRLWQTFQAERYVPRIAGAVMGRFAGCTLGAPVEFWSVEDMRGWAEYCGQAFPPTEYWHQTKRPNELRYEVSCFFKYEKDKLDGVPVDDDVTYVILGLLILEQCGHHFTTREAGEVWKKYLPRACTAEEVVLHHLNRGVDANIAAKIDNPYQQWIGADIRADAFGYAAPGYPEKAAEMAYRDAYLTHRRNGVYGEMYFAAVISAAFAVDTVEAALRIGLQEIPAECLLARDIHWAFEKAPEIHDYLEARAAAEEYFDWMSGVHTNLNACLTIFGLLLGGDDFGKVIGEITAMGYDNDCNAATAGSIWGAVHGIGSIPQAWYEGFHNKVYTYLNDVPMISLDKLCARFGAIARQVI